MGQWRGTLSVCEIKAESLFNKVKSWTTEVWVHVCWSQEIKLSSQKNIRMGAHQCRWKRDNWGKKKKKRYKCGVSVYILSRKHQRNESPKPRSQKKKKK